MNFAPINTSLFALLPLTLYGYKLGCFLPVIAGCGMFLLLSTITNTTVFKWLFFSICAVVLVGAALSGGEIIIIANRINLSIDPYFFLIGLGLSFAYTMLTNLAKVPEQAFTHLVETASLLSIHLFLLFFSTITAHVAVIGQSEAITVFVYTVFLAVLFVVHRKTCAAIGSFRLVKIQAHPGSPPLTEGASPPLPPQRANDSVPSATAFTDPFLTEKWGKMVTPCLPRLQELHMDGVLLELFTIYDTVGKNAPSVYGLDNSSTRFSNQDFSLLQQITLADHSFRVAELALHKIMYRYVDTWEYLWPQQLIISLGHDIAKIPHLAGDYTTRDHGVNSANFVASVFRQYAPELKRELIDPMLDAIRDHHKKFDDNKWSPKPSEKLKLLMECDKEAREIEKDITRNKWLIASSPSSSAADDEDAARSAILIPEDIPISTESVPASSSPLQQGGKSEVVDATLDDDIVGCKYEEFIKPSRGDNDPSTVQIRDLKDDFVKEVLTYLKKNYVNRVVNKAFYAVSQKDGYVYCWTDIIYDLIQIVAEKRNSRSSFLFVEKYKYSVLLSFYRNLKSKGFAPPDEVVNSGRYFANTFTFFNPKKNEDSSGFYMLIAADAFGEKIEDLESQRFDEPELAHIAMKPKSKKSRG